jgi:predicted phage baseplate assembly protein
MSSPWWTTAGVASRLVPFGPVGGLQPQPVDPSSRAHLVELMQRAPYFVPEWIPTRDDAGGALVRLFGSELQPLLDRLNRLPERTFVEFLRTAGIQQLPGGIVAALVAFEATSGAPQAAFVPAGFQIGARPADGSPQALVVFETVRDVNVVSGKIVQAAIQQGRVLLEISDPTGGTPFRPFGDRAIAGRSFLIGIESSVAPGPTLSMGLIVAVPSGSPPPSSAGGVQPAPMTLPPVLQWEVLDGTSFQSADVIVDETSGLATSGVVELRVPRRWRRGQPGDLFWLRVRIGHGSYEEPPTLSRLLLNAVRVEAAETIRSETLEHMPGVENRMRVSRTPVIPGSLILEVQEGAATGDLFDLEDPSAGSEEPATGVRRWIEVPDLSQYGPNDRVFTLDPLTGELTFGDGHHGALLPRGFRHVRALSYRVGGGARGAVDADKITTLIHSAPFLRGATNPQRASGGTDMEPRDAAIRRGPEEIRARGRAVTERDYELLARRARGASVARAHAVSGLHPVLPGLPIPGVVGVFVVPASRAEAPPVADELTLRTVATFLAEDAAPAGVEVVAASPRFHRVRAEVLVQITDPAADPGETVRRVIDELNLYFDPLRGGDDEAGWPFGAPIRFMPLLRRLLTRVTSATAIPRLNLTIDGARFPSCVDVPISPHGLLWPENHQVTLRVSGGQP